MSSHQIAVNAYLVINEKFLLLKRTKKPLIWGPPGGRLSKNEDPISGLKREVYEETRLKIEVIQPITTWFGVFNKKHLLSIDYLSYANDEDVYLSNEHSRYSWFSLDELHQKRSMLFVYETGFQLSDFMRAWIIHLCLQQEFQRLEKVYTKKHFKKYLLNQKQYLPEQKF